MAKATAIKHYIVRPKRVRRVILELTEGEADFLINVCGRIEGDSNDSPVKYAVRIRKALSKLVGYDWLETDAFQLSTGYVSYTTYDNLRRPAK
jgi:hypothetical protein